jgi:Asp-tRNA(Asn)/Glu-tRNA(Gln) amidotransferase A subunit family amidase
MLRARELSATELTRHLLERIGRLNPQLNAIVTLCEEHALAAAAESDRRLAGHGEVRRLEGLPITVKDAICTAGVRSTDGTKLLEHYVPDFDAPAVARLLAAGAVLLGKTNLSELAYDYDCDNPVFGATVNPWNPNRIPGGSSGGEAAALSAGLTALGLGSDYAGSIRVPAAFCGVVGLKPSWGTVPLAGHLMGPLDAFTPWPPPLAHMATIGPLARTVDDLTLAYNLVKGPDPRSVYTVPSADVHPDSVDVRHVRCAVFARVGDLPLRAEIGDAVERAAAALRQTGVPVDVATPPIGRAGELWLAYHSADGEKLLIDALGDGIDLLRERLRSYLRYPPPQKTAAEFFTLSIERDTYRVKLAEFMERYRIIVGPAFGVTAFPHGALSVDVDGETYDVRKAGWPARWVNCAGLPAVVVPAGRDREGLPIGVQVVGRAFDEETVLAVGRALERELGGFQPPPV